MTRKINRNIKLFLYIILLLGIFPLSTFAQGLIQVPAPAGVATGGLYDIIVNILDMALTLVSFIAVIMIIFGGFRFIISGGDPDAAAGAKNTILYAIIGLIVIGLSAAIVNFVIGMLGTV